MTDLIDRVKLLVGMETTATTPFADDTIQDALDETATFFRGERLSDLGGGQYVADFSHYTQVGFFEDTAILRESDSTDSVAHTPDSKNLVNGSFVFNTDPDIDLYLFADAFNPYFASANLIFRQIDHGTLPLASQARGDVSEKYNVSEKAGTYRKMGKGLNQKTPTLSRG